MITSFFYVLIFSVALYIIWSLLRILFYGITAPVSYTHLKDGDKTVDTGGYNFGDYTFDRYYGGMRYSSLSSTNVTWEIATKHDLGIDSVSYTHLQTEYCVYCLHRSIAR